VTKNLLHLRKLVDEPGVFAPDNDVWMGIVDARK
jgi:hypothetical protein